jgi:ketosteroid isomerase-like protein
MLGGVADARRCPRSERPWRRLLRLGIAALAAAGLVVPSARSALAQAGDAVAVAQTFRAAIAARDAEAVLALWADDGVYLHDDHAAVAPLGREELRQRLPVVFAANQQPVAGTFRVAGDVVTYDWRAPPDPAAGRDVPALAGTDELVVREGKIHRWTQHPDPVAADRQRQALDAVLAVRATQRAQAAEGTAVAASGVLRRTPDTQGRRTPAPALWAAGVAGILLLTGLAALARPRPAP